MQAFNSNTTTGDVLKWTSEDPRTSTLFNPYGIMYRFQTDETRGKHVTSLLRSTRNKEDRVAKLEWAPNGGLGSAVIGKVAVPMVDLVKPDQRNHTYRSFFGPDGQRYTWRPSPTNSDVLLVDAYGQTVACLHQTRPTRYPIGDVHAELHFFKNSAGVMLPPLMDAITVTAMLYRFCMAYGL